MNRTPARQSGFTLIELMIVVAIVAILATIAYPSYQESVLKGRRAEARTALLELMQQQERYMTQSGTYVRITNNAGTASTVPSSAANIFKTYSGEGGTPNYYLSADFCPGSTNARDCIQVVATPSATRPDPAANALTLTSTGVKDCSGPAGTAGSAPNPRLCWP